METSQAADAVVLENVDERDPLERAQAAFDEAHAAAGRLGQAMRPETAAVVKMCEAQYWALMGVHKKLGELEQCLQTSPSLPKVADNKVAENIAALVEDYTERNREHRSATNDADAEENGPTGL